MSAGGSARGARASHGRGWSATCPRSRRGSSPAPPVAARASSSGRDRLVSEGGEGVTPELRLSGFEWSWLRVSSGLSEGEGRPERDKVRLRLRRSSGVEAAERALRSTVTGFAMLLSASTRPKRAKFPMAWQPCRAVACRGRRRAEGWLQARGGPTTCECCAA